MSEVDDGSSAGDDDDAELERAFVRWWDDALLAEIARAALGWHRGRGDRRGAEEGR